ncbi:hypothetical protein HCN44_004023 [Aphidius gifuensis]|uniref:Uncharacterized protein n=1 Tax=Aphidius gifuensis TaxID=684658 RepID=A0A834XYF6_APHGI|nr:COA8 family protein CG14806, mitochondrial [Aphidius gifuensis]KAF7994551.1 hypothetical protein HCN44_004023 [Aphidius gifuensis]
MMSYQKLKHLQIIKQSYSKLTNHNLKATEQVPEPGDVDKIGPADDISNLRKIIFKKNDNETETEKLYREARDKTQKWNHKFWSDHNTKFTTERKEFQKKLMVNGKDSVTADEMSVFYKNFLDKNWKNHIDYNISWYKQNLKILILEIKVRLSKLKFK